MGLEEKLAELKKMVGELRSDVRKAGKYVGHYEIDIDDIALSDPKYADALKRIVGTDDRSEIAEWLVEGFGEVRETVSDLATDCVYAEYGGAFGIDIYVNESCVRKAFEAGLRQLIRWYS